MANSTGCECILISKAVRLPSVYPHLAPTSIILSSTTHRRPPLKIAQKVLTLVTSLAEYYFADIAAGDTSQVIQWDADDTDNYVVLSTQLQNQKPFVETRNIAQDTTVYYSFKKVCSQLCTDIAFIDGGNDLDMSSNALGACRSKGLVQPGGSPASTQREDSFSPNQSTETSTTPKRRISVLPRRTPPSPPPSFFH